MSVTILTWNSDVYRELFSEWQGIVGRSKRNTDSKQRWSVGRRKNIPAGERVFMLRQGREPRGIVAAGRTTCEPYAGQNWNGLAGTTNYIGVRWDGLVPDLDQPLPLGEISGADPHGPWQRIYFSGFTIREAGSIRTIEALWDQFVDEGSVVSRPRAD